MTSTFPWHQSVTAFCQLTILSGSYDAFRRSVCSKVLRILPERCRGVKMLTPQPLVTERLAWLSVDRLERGSALGAPAGPTGEQCTFRRIPRPRRGSFELRNRLVETAGLFEEVAANA